MTPPHYVHDYPMTRRFAVASDAHVVFVVTRILEWGVWTVWHANHEHRLTLVYKGRCVFAFDGMHLVILQLMLSHICNVLTKPFCSVYFGG